MEPQSCSRLSPAWEEGTRWGGEGGGGRGQEGRCRDGGRAGSPTSLGSDPNSAATQCCDPEHGSSCRCASGSSPVANVCLKRGRCSVIAVSVPGTVPALKILQEGRQAKAGIFIRKIKWGEKVLI